MPFRPCRVPVAALAVLLPLAACSAADEEGSDGSYGTQPATFAAREDLFDENTADMQPLGFTDTDSLPDSGGATYTGALFLDDGPELFGRAQLEADFDSDDLTGTAWDFVDSNDNDVGGELALAGLITRGGNPASSLAIGMSGQLVYPGDGVQTVEGSLPGAFRGSDGEFIHAFDTDAITICDQSVGLPSCRDVTGNLLVRDVD